MAYSADKVIRPLNNWGQRAWTSGHYMSLAAQQCSASRAAKLCLFAQPSLIGSAQVIDG